MKKRLLVLILFCFTSIFAFSEIKFQDRFIELKIDLPVGISNNSFRSLDYLKEEALIDLTKIAQEIPKEGFNFKMSVNPSVRFLIDLPVGPEIGINVGANIYSSLGFSKDIFDFLGFGNEDSIDINENIDAFLDFFVYAEATLGWKFKNFGVVIAPSVFTALIHASTDNSYIKVYNDEESNFGYKLNGKAKVYSMINLNKDCFTPEFISDYNNLLKSYINWSSLGFDASVSFNLKSLRYLDVTGTFNFPIIPCTLKKETEFTCSSEYKTGLSDLLSSDDTEKAKPDFNYDFGTTKDSSYSINRPLKLNFSGIFSPHNDIMDYQFGLGVGLLHPFAKDKESMVWYFDYLFGTRIGLWNFASLNLSTERTEQIYIHKVQLSVDVRFIRFVLGAALESPSFASSFRASGIGAYANVTIGL